MAITQKRKFENIQYIIKALCKDDEEYQQFIDYLVVTGSDNPSNRKVRQLRKFKNEHKLVMQIFKDMDCLVFYCGMEFISDFQYWICSKYLVAKLRSVIGLSSHYNVSQTLIENYDGTKETTPSVAFGISDENILRYLDGTIDSDILDSFYFGK